MLEGVKRVWGKEGYLPQKPSSETSAADELNGARQSSDQETAAHASQPEPEPESEPSYVDQEKHQLASSLFVGLGSQSATSLVGLP